MTVPEIDFDSRTTVGHGYLPQKAVSGTPPKFSINDRYSVVASLRAMRLLMQGSRPGNPPV